MAGFIALSQTDIKRVIAYSTMSQIAYMFVGVGLGAYWAGIYHLFTHAFFKALLFMAAGIVIHALSGEQDLRRMGGMRRFLPRTYVCMAIGTLALVGVFPLSGSLSKDPIIATGSTSAASGAISPSSAASSARSSPASTPSACCSWSSTASRRRTRPSTPRSTRTTARRR